MDSINTLKHILWILYKKTSSVFDWHTFPCLCPKMMDDVSLHGVSIDCGHVLIFPNLNLQYLHHL